MPEKIADLSIQEFELLVGKLVNEVPKTFFVDKVREIVQQEMAAEHKNFWVPAEKHYLDHKMQDECAANRADWIANHEFITRMRKNGEKAWNIGFYVFIVSATGFFMTIFWDGIITTIRSLVSK